MALTKVSNSLIVGEQVNVLDYGAVGDGGNLMTEQELLLACYRSGQITERQWREHLKEDPSLRDAWLIESDPDNTGYNLIG